LRLLDASEGRDTYAVTCSHEQCQKLEGRYRRHVGDSVLFFDKLRANRSISVWWP
jgi:hypothetical protein